MKPLLRKLYWISSAQFGIDILKTIKSIRGIPKFINDWIYFKRNYVGQLDLLPCLHDWFEEAGTTRSEYFWQDLHIARLIFDKNPKKHVDIGSRLDGFVAHVATYREIEVFDIRKISVDIPGVVYRQVDLMSLPDQFVDYCDSLSCLHALEHFGLGRYGDPIDPYGYKRGLENMANMLCDGGILYLAVPVGKERVEFNGHRIFNPLKLIELASQYRLSLQSFGLIDIQRQFIQVTGLENALPDLQDIPYALGIFIFTKQLKN